MNWAKTIGVLCHGCSLSLWMELKVMTGNIAKRVKSENMKGGGERRCNYMWKMLCLSELESNRKQQRNLDG